MAITALGPVETLRERLAEVMTDVAGVQAHAQTDDGVPVAVSITGDSQAAVDEALMATREHMLASTSDPAAVSAVVEFFSRVGV